MFIDRAFRAIHIVALSICALAILAYSIVMAWLFCSDGWYSGALLTVVSGAGVIGLFVAAIRFSLARGV